MTPQENMLSLALVDSNQNACFNVACGFQVPLQKDPGWLWDTLERWTKTCTKKLSGAVPDHIQEMASADLAGELAWLKAKAENIDSPVVFCHNDMQEGNILMLQGENENNNGEPKLVLIGNILLPPAFTFLIISLIQDFEYCSYNYRAYDLANHFMEWTYNYTNPERPYYWENQEDYPTKEQRLRFIRVYLEELGLKEDPMKLMKEVEFFNLVCNLFWGLWSIVNADTSQIPFSYWVSVFKN